MIQFLDCVIENREFILDNRTEVYYFGHDLTLKDCRLVIKVPARALVVARSQLIHCTIEARRELKEFRWWSASLEGCRFKGRFTGCDFGHWPDIVPGGAIRDCDFTEARLHWCRFTGCDASTLRFPSWPCVTVLNAVQRLDELRKIKWPGNSGLLLDIWSSNRPDTAASTFNALEFAREHDTNAEELKAALQGVSGVIY